MGQDKIGTYTMKLTVNLKQTIVSILNKNSRVAHFERATVLMLQIEPREYGIVPTRPQGY